MKVNVGRTSDVNGTGASGGAVWNSLARFDFEGLKEVDVDPVKRNTRRARIPVWLLPVQAVAGVVAWAVASGGESLRGLLLACLGWVMTLSLATSLEAGLLAMLLFEPFRGFLRRAQYLFVSYSGTDPIHLLTPAVTMLACAIVLSRHRESLFRATPLAGAVTILAAICCVQVFNPAQGGVFIGLTGALFVLVPMVWFYFGQACRADFMITALRAVVVLGVIASLQGLYQSVFGFPAFEQFWIDNTDFNSAMTVGNVKRAIATFSGAEEWARYAQIGALAAVGFGLASQNHVRRAAWLAASLWLVAALFLSGQRSAIFTFGVGLMTFFALGARTWRARLPRLLLPVVIVLPLALIPAAPSEDDVMSMEAEQILKTMLSHSIRGVLRPSGEGSVGARIDNWRYLANEVVLTHPFGVGLGATSIGMDRFNSEGSREMRPTDSSLIDFIVACGLPAGLLCLWILARAVSIARRNYEETVVGTQDAVLWRTIVSLTSMLTLTTVFGNTLTLYSVAPVAWLLIGWTSAEESRRRALTASRVATV